ncbi:MAG: efflux RND transporter periplasmic adaptor subunit, partial [Deltaproteobacteria bacterium]|nr:efflux RND transporter periplasmic adaptor subunit [Deltaproteobacteria bacterium]
VKAGEVMAVTDSRELADAKGGYLAARERLALANSKFKREEGLWKKKISSEQEYLDARQAMVETRIEIRSAEQKLHALGFSERYVRNLPNQPDVELTRYKILAPIDGTVIAKHITLGEALKEDAEIFVVADLSSVWADLRVYQKDLAKIRKGQKAVITVQNYPEGIRGEIFYVGPLVGESTRTGLARVELPNPEGRLRPGSFITAKVAVDIVKDSLIVPKSALLNVHGETSVFVQTDEGFEPRPVQLGKANETDVEITGGLDFGDQYVAKGGFTLKAQLSKGAFGDGHNH